MKTQSIIALLSAFSFIISTLNLYVFWTPFGINIFDHLTTSDILVRSIKPLFIGLGVLLMTAFLEIHGDELSTGANEIHEKRTLIDKITSFVLSTFGFQMLALAAFIHYKSENNLYISAYGIAAMVLIIQFMIKIGTYQKIVIDYKIPKNAVNLAIVLTAMTTSTAYMNAENIKDKIAYTRAEVTLKNSKEKLEKIYIGETQNTLFFYSFYNNEVTEVSKNNVLKIVKSKSSCDECKFEKEEQISG